MLPFSLVPLIFFKCLYTSFLIKYLLLTSGFSWVIITCFHGFQAYYLEIDHRRFLSYIFVTPAICVVGIFQTQYNPNRTLHFHIQNIACGDLNKSGPHRRIGSELLGGLALSGVGVALMEEVCL